MRVFGSLVAYEARHSTLPGMSVAIESAPLPRALGGPVSVVAPPEVADVSWADGLAATPGHRNVPACGARIAV